MRGGRVGDGVVTVARQPVVVEHAGSQGQTVVMSQRHVVQLAAEKKRQRVGVSWGSPVRAPVVGG